jgi:uncharacterized membrane protein HdeD (DUF308 family)
MTAAEAIVIRTIHRESVGWSIALSVLLIVIGLVALLAPVLAGVAVEALIGWLLILGGISHLVLAWHVRGAGHHLWEALIGLAYLLAGGYLLLHPLAGLIGLTLILGVYLLLKGVFELLAGILLRRALGSGWMILDAIFSLVLGILIWRQLPYSASWVVGTLLGIAILFSGISRLAVALAARSHHAALVTG